MKFRPFDATSIAATRAAWRNDALKGGAFLPDVDQQLDWAENHIELTDNGIAYGVFKEQSHVAAGVCELLITKPSVHSKWVKFLRLRLRPSIDLQLFDNKPAGVESAIEAYIACVVGVFHVKNEHKATIIKVYGRTQQQMAFLTVLVAKLQQQDDITFKSSIEGRWLVLNWKKQ